MGRVWAGVAAVLVLAAAAPAWAASWSWLNSAQERFAVELPGASTVRRWEEDVGGGKTIPTVEYAVTADGRDWLIGTAFFGFDPTEAQIAPALGAAIDDVMAADKGTQTWRRTVRVSGKLAVEAEYSLVKNGVPWRARMLVTFGGQRMYSLILREPASLPAADQERAARSLRML